MKPLILFSLAGLLLGACQAPQWTDPPTPSPESTPWQLSSVDWSNPTIMHLQVGENELRIFNRTRLTRLDARGNRVESSVRSIWSIDLFSRPVFSHQFFLYKHSQRQNFFAIEAVDWRMNYEGYASNIWGRGYDVNQPPRTDFSFAAFLNGTESGATNRWGEFLVAGLTHQQPDRLTLLALDPYTWFRFDRTFADARRWQIALPAEAGLQPRRLRGLGDDYLVSTEQATFLLRREGSFTQLWAAGATHAFAWGEEWYAEVEATLYRSTDEGTNWQALGPGASRLGSGEYYVLDSTLVYAREDSLYRVTPTTGALQALQNQGLEANQITSVASFADSIYVGTLTGLYTKPRHALY